MSYDYDSLVSTIIQHRQAKAWQESVDAFSVLSSHCPMTPLMWIQYAHDTSMLLLEVSQEDALEIRVDTLQLGLAEFPGCALMHLHFVELLMELAASKNQKEVIVRTQEAFESAIQAVGRGSHRNEDALVVKIYHNYASFTAKHLPNQDAIGIFCRRAEVPMKEANNTLQCELETFASEHSLKITNKHLENLEEGRRQVAAWFGTLASLEDDVDEAMQQELILSRYDIDLETIDWNALILSTDSRYWMGLGGSTSGLAFLKYAHTCSRFPKHLPAEQVQRIQSLTIPIYERGVSECPTFEALWLAYVRGLSWLTLHSENPAALASTLQSVSARAVRNCPYSLLLAQARIGASLPLAQVGHSVLDPDSLVAVVDETINAKFLTAPQHHLELYLAAIRTIKGRMLSILIKDFDESCNDKFTGALHVADSEDEEIHDLIQDIRELYDTADKHFCKQQAPESRFVLWYDRSKSETYLFEPLIQALDGENKDVSKTESVRCFENLLRLHPRPESFRSYIQMLLAQAIGSARHLARKFQKIRYLYHKAITALSSKPSDDHLKEVTKHNICHEYIEFEKLYGSDKSLGVATKLVQRKLRFDMVGHGKSSQRVDSSNNIDGGRKRKNESPPKERPLNTKKSKLEDTLEPKSESTKSVRQDMKNLDELVSKEPALKEKSSSVTAANGKDDDKPEVHKVTVGNMEYPAHPFTIKVTNLAPKAEEMDLVDMFRPKCGAIVHVKIIREKTHHGKGKSKGWGLVQFENRDSVESALALHDTIGLHEKVMQIERSHMPAVSLVPPGMHRVQPKGEGKVSKRNEKRKEQKGDSTEKSLVQEKLVETSLEQPLPSQVPPESNAGILAFRPRGVSKKGNRKAKVSLK